MFRKKQKIELAAEPVTQSPEEAEQPAMDITLINRARLKVDKHSLHASITDMKRAECHREDFRVPCKSECCGICPVRIESFNLLINEVLDEETAQELKTLCEKTGIRSDGEKCFNCDECKNTERKKVFNYIDYLWRLAYARSALRY